MTGVEQLCRCTHQEGFHRFGWPRGEPVQDWSPCQIQDCPCLDFEAAPVQPPDAFGSPKPTAEVSTPHRDESSVRREA